MTADPRLVRAPRTMPEGRFSTLTWAIEIPPVEILGAPLVIRSMNADIGTAVAASVAAFPPHAGGALDDDDPGLVSILDRGPDSKRRFALYSGRTRISVAKEDGAILNVLWSAFPAIAAATSDDAVLGATLASTQLGTALITGRPGGPTEPIITGLVEAAVPGTTVSVVGIAIADGRVTAAALPRSDNGTGAPARGAADGPAAVRVVVCPVPATGSELEVTQLRPAEGVIALCGEALNLHRHGQDGLDALSRLVQGAEGGCWRIGYDMDDPSAAVAAISELLGSS